MAAAPRPNEWTLQAELAADIDYVDPALAWYLPTWQLEYATCLKLVNYPDGGGPRTAQLVPEAAPFPTISHDGRTYTFELRTGFTRFSNGAPVTATAFAHAISRLRDRRMAAPGAIFADDFAQVLARGNRLVLRLKAPAPDLLSRLALPFFCAVPPRTRIAPNGLEAAPPSAGPYFIDEWERNRLVVLRRNPYYRGPRPRNAARIELAIGRRPGDSVARVETGATDWYPLPRTTPQVRRGTRARVARTMSTRFLAFNNRAGRPFAERRLRVAVAQALDRTELARVGGYPHGTPTDRLLSPLTPGYRPGRLYPLRLSEPSLARARALAARHVPASVVLVASNRSPAPAQAEMIKAELREIGIEVKIQLFPSAMPECWPAREWDLTIADWRPDHPDPSALFRHLFAGLAECVVEPPGPALAAGWRERFAAADGKSGPARLRALGKLELDLLAEDLPATGLYVHNAVNLFSERIGCAGTHHVYVVDLAALCVRR